MRAAASILVLLVLAWAIGLLAFASRVDHSTPAAPPPVSDGVVALTGASDARITAAMALLENGKARRMLVSGVNPTTSRAEVRGVAKADRHIYDCCVDLGYQATDTVGNARETAHWVDAEGYHSPYAIRTTELDAHHWWRTSAGLKRMTLEYCKYLIILTRTEATRLIPHHPKAPDQNTGLPGPANT